MIPLIDDPVLIADRPKLSPGEESTTVGTLQVTKEPAVEPTIRKTSSLRIDRDVQTSTTKSKLLLKRDDGLAVLGELNVFVKLKEFERLPLAD